MSLLPGVRRTGTRLDPILEAVSARARERGARRARVRSQGRARFQAALGGAELAFLAECKRRAPSTGELSKGLDLGERAHAYKRGGAAALSILTEQDHFGGAPADLAAVAACGLPRLRKDFTLSLDMVEESVGMGADAVLLICACLDDGLLRDLAVCAREQGLFALVEVHDEEELERALALEPDAVGVNARDLRDFSIDLGTVERLLPRIPAGVLRVAESGLHGVEDLKRVRAAGADAALVGTALMRATDPARTLREWGEAVR
jgi:indole-3-glycerol phosphate synthase